MDQLPGVEGTPLALRMEEMSIHGGDTPKSNRHASCGAIGMSVREIPAREWAGFLEKLGREHRAWLATVDRNGHVEAREQPLQAISAEQGIDIRIGAKAIHVDEPQAVRVEETPEGATQAVQIDEATGRRLTLRFRVAVAPGALDGIAAAERSS